MTNTALFLAQELKAAIDVVAIAAIFHDVGRPAEQETGISHAEISAQIAESFLNHNNLQKMKYDVTHAIKAHRFSGNIKPETIEAQILQDADALDALGGIGLFRAISYTVENQKGIEVVIQHCYDKLFLLPDKMHFPISRKIAKQRVKILKQFVEQATNEIETDSWKKNCTICIQKKIERFK